MNYGDLLYEDLYETLKDEYEYLWDEWYDSEKAHLADMLLKEVRDECYYLESGYSNALTPDEILAAARKKMDSIKDMTDEAAGAELRYYLRNGMYMPLHFERG